MDRSKIQHSERIGINNRKEVAVFTLPKGQTTMGKILCEIWIAVGFKKGEEKGEEKIKELKENKNYGTF